MHYVFERLLAVWVSEHQGSFTHGAAAALWLCHCCVHAAFVVAVAVQWVDGPVRSAVQAVGVRARTTPLQQQVAAMTGLMGVLRPSASQKLHRPFFQQLLIKQQWGGSQVTA